MLLKRMFLLATLVASFPTYAAMALNEPISPIPDPKNQYPKIIKLGDKLFHDVRFSSDQKVSCASCHSLVTGGMDGMPVSFGANNGAGNINAPTIFNSSLNFKQFWDGRAANLKEQLNGPINNEHEMDSSWLRVLRVVKNDPTYESMFLASYGDGVTVENIKNALVVFEESLLTPNSRFDLYLKGNAGALNQDEKAGYQLFKSYGCVSCHQGVNMGGNMFQKLGIVNEYTFTKLGSNNRDLGRFNITKDKEDLHVFKVPSLRNIALTAPYLHDGSEDTLEGVVSKMMYHQLGIPASQEEMDLIVKFLKTLTGKYKGESLK